MGLPLPSRLLFVADSEQAPGGLAELVGRAAEAGLRFIEIRRKSPLGTAARVAELRTCLEAAPAATLLVNDRVDVALAAGAAGAHLGQEDLPAVEARRLLGPERLLGLSTHDELQFAAARALPVDYIALGPLFSSQTKFGHAEPLGLAPLERCSASTDLPVVAIGGLCPDRARQALEAGASAVAVASGLARGDLAANAAAYLEACGENVDEPWVLSGLPGSGKSTVGRLVAEAAGRRFVDLDAECEAEAGRSIADLFEMEGEAAFRARELAALLRLRSRPDGRLVIALGGGSLDSTDCRLLLSDWGARRLWLDASARDCAARLHQAVASRPLLAGAGTGPRLEAELASLLARRRARYEQDSLRVDAEGEPAEVAERCLRLIGRAPAR